MAINPPSTTISPASQSPRRDAAGSAAPSGRSTPVSSRPNAHSAARGAMQPAAADELAQRLDAVAGEGNRLADVATQRNGIDAATPPKGPGLIDQLQTMRRLTQAKSRSELIAFFEVLAAMLDVGPFQTPTFAGRDPQLAQVADLRVAVAAALHTVMGGVPANLWEHAIRIDKALDQVLKEAGKPRNPDRAAQAPAFGIMSGILFTNVVNLASIADTKAVQEEETGGIEGGRAGEIATYLVPILAEVSPYAIHDAAARLQLSDKDVIKATTDFMIGVSTGYATGKLEFDRCQPFLRLLVEAGVKFDPQRCWPQASDWGQ
jgi:hypothetical protein